MTLEGIVIGLIGLGVGLALAFWGFKIFLILLPIWGFFAGFMVGASGTSYIFGDAFLATILGWVVGFLIGILFAVLSYLYYWGAVALLGGILGYQLMLGLLTWIGFSADGWFTFILALIVGGIFAVGFLVIGMPAVLAIVATAIVGAGAAVAGIVTALGVVPYQALQNGIWGAYGKVDISWLWLIVAIVVAVAGAIYQARSVADLRGAITSDQYMNPGLDTTSGAAAA